MKRLFVVLLLCLGFSAGLIPRSESAAASEPEFSWPDSLLVVRTYTDGLKRLLIERDTVEARRLLTEAVELDSTCAPAWYYLSMVSPTGERREATEWARRAYALDTLNKWYVQQYGQRLLREGRYDEGRIIYNRLSQLDPTNPDNLRILAILYQQAGMPYTAVDLLDSAEMLFGKNPILSSMKRQLLLQTGQIDRALEEAQQMAESIPYDAENHVVLAELYGASGRDSLAIEEYNRALEIDSAYVPALVSLAEFYNKHNDARAYLSVSRRLFENDRLPLDEKVRILKQLTLDQRFYRNNFFQIGELISTLLLRYPNEKEVVDMQGTHMILSGDAGQALIFYKLHLNDQPPQLDYFRTVIDMEIFFKRPDSVDLYVKRALRLFPNETDLYVSRAHAQVYAGNCRRGVRDYTRALKYARTDSMRSQIWGFIGDAWHQLGEESQGGSAQARCRRKCFEAYDRALGYNYDNASVLNNYAYFTCEQTDDPKRLDQAFAMAARAVELGENNSTTLDTYAWVLFKLGRLQEARRAMQQAISFDSSDSAVLFYHYGEILAALGETFLAETYLNRAIEAGYPDPEAVKARIEELKTKP